MKKKTVKKRKKRVLFIIKPFFIEPLGLMYLSSAAKKAGHQVELVLADNSLEDAFIKYNPDIVGYSVMTGDQKFYLEINRRLKEIKTKVISIFGGPHPTFFPEMINEEGVDVVCRGEGEETFVELLNGLRDGKDISRIQNLYVKIRGKVIANGVRDFSDIDSLSFPDRDLVYKFPEIKNDPIKHFIAARGCPFSCSYCFNEAYASIYQAHGKRVRFRNPASVITEIEEVIRSSPTKFIYFQDDTFTLNTRWLEDFTKEYGKKIGMPFHCHVRPNTITEEKVKLLKQAGCYSVHIAAETANDRLRNEVLKRNMSYEQILKAAKILKEYGIRVMLQNMIGLPTGTLKDDLETLEMNIKCKPDYAWVSIFQPYPGTTIGEFCRKEGLYTGDFSDIESNFFTSSKLNFSKKYKNQLSNLQKLFAILVESPILHEFGLSYILINMPNTPRIRKKYAGVYKQFRELGDERLYGFKL